MRFYLITRDGEPVAAYLTESQRGAGLAADYHPAARYVFAERDAAPWPDDGSESFGRTPRAMEATSAGLLADHAHGWRFTSAGERKLARSHCAACALSGYGMTAAQLRVSGPDYAGWARVYVQASRAVPAGWSAPFWRELAGAGRIDPDGQTGDANERYGDALRRDVATFGLRFGTPDGRTVDGSAVRR